MPFEIKKVSLKIYGIYFFLFIIFIFFIEILIFSFLIKYSSDPSLVRDSDLLAVFGGEIHTRYPAALTLERVYNYKAFCVSDSSREKVLEYESCWGEPVCADIIIEPDARSTTQNAFYVRRIMIREGFKSVTVVTSWYHVPRAWFLMKLATKSDKLEVRIVSAEMPPKYYFLKSVFWFEIFKIWASLATWYVNFPVCLLNLLHSMLYYFQSILVGPISSSW